jgi:hypothetical protein
MQMGLLHSAAEFLPSAVAFSIGDQENQNHQQWLAHHITVENGQSSTV